VERTKNPAKGDGLDFLFEATIEVFACKVAAVCCVCEREVQVDRNGGKHEAIAMQQRSKWRMDRQQETEEEEKGAEATKENAEIKVFAATKDVVRRRQGRMKGAGGRGRQARTMS
jgi:hypothetical protein